MQTARSKCARKDSFAAHCPISFLFGCLFLLAVSTQPLTLHAQTYTDLHDFNYTTDGAYPYEPGVVARGRDGSLYGATYQGGVNSDGTIYKITPSGTFTVLYSFSGTDGVYPFGGVTLGTDGNLYGATYEGGTNGYGTLFKITPSGTLTTLHNFTGSDGCYPYAPPVQGKKGLVFYGTTGCNTAYSIKPSGTFKEISSNVPFSYSQLLLANDGNLYETLYTGGASGYGAIVKLSTRGTVTTLYNFDSSHGANPLGPLAQGSDKNLYGTAVYGGANGYGVIFRLSLKKSYTDLYDFTGATDGCYPSAGVVAGSDGNIYGAAPSCGNSGFGSLFELTKGGVFSVLSGFDYYHGYTPYSTPMQDTNGTIYGGAYSGGADGYGVFYSLNNGISPFVSLVGFPAGTAGSTVEILGQGFSTATAVNFGSGSATFNVVNDTYMTATVPSDGTIGPITVTESGGTLTSSQNFKVLPVLTSFSPTSGPVGTTVTITGSGFIGTTSVTFNGVKATFTVNSGTQITATVPSGATTGKIKITTPGGKATSSGPFTVQ